MNEKILAKIQREARKLAASGFPFHAFLLSESFENGTVTSTAERVAIMLEKGHRFADAKRLRDTLRPVSI